MNGFAVLDLETTGFAPSRGHRIVEIGVVLTDPGGAIEYEWSSLVDPGRDVGPTHIHGITDDMVEGAPIFAELSGDLGFLLHDRVLVAHNARFDVAFLREEWPRTGAPDPYRPLCTMRLALARELPGRLAECCAALGLVNADAHRALGDARVTAELLRRLEPRPDEIPPAIRIPRGARAWSGVRVARTIAGDTAVPEIAEPPARHRTAGPFRGGSA